MNMNRRQTLVAAGIVGVLVVAAVTLWCVQRGQKATMPAWLDPQQPEDGVYLPLTADQSWAANRARPMAACCTGRTAGTRIRRTYPGSLAESPDSLVRLGVNLQLGV